jgi:hypothetical protein
MYESLNRTCRQRFVSLAAQKFIANICHDSLQIYKHRRKQAAVRLKEQGLKDQTAVLMTEDLAEALQEVPALPPPLPPNAFLADIFL